MKIEDWFKDHPLKVSQGDFPGNLFFYHFRDEGDKRLTIHIPLDAKRNVQWGYIEEIGRSAEYYSLESIPEYYQEVICEANSLLVKRNKLRKLFI